jgi:hypothetical protein
MRYSNIEDAFTPLSSAPLPHYAVPDEFYLPEHMRDEFETYENVHGSNPSLIEFLVLALLIVMVIDLLDFGTL